MLTDIEWIEDEHTGERMPDYKWVSARSHKRGCTYTGVNVLGIPPALWTEFQSLAGDSTDGISGAHGIGAKIASDLILRYTTAERAIEAAIASDPFIKPKKRDALIEFADKLEITRQLVTLKTNLELPHSTRI
jgi:5'-3' exonuclease